MLQPGRRGGAVIAATRTSTAIDVEFIRSFVERWVAAWTMHKQQAKPRLVDLRVDVVGAGDFTPIMVTEALTDCLARSGVPADSIDHCLIPEGNVGWMLDSLREAGLMTEEWQAMEGKIFDNL